MERSEKTTAKNDKWLVVLAFIGLSTSRLASLMLRHSSSSISGLRLDWHGNLVIFGILAVVLIVFLISRLIMSRAAARALAYVCAAGQAVVLLAVAALAIFQVDIYLVGVALTVACEVFSVVLMAMWMRVFIPMDMRLTSALIFGSVAVVELIACAFALVPFVAGTLLCVIVCLLQIALIAFMRVGGEDVLAQGELRFGWSGRLAHPKAACALVCLGVIVGVLVGFPDGTDIVLSGGSRWIYGIAAALGCLALVGAVLKARASFSSWLLVALITICICVALVLFLSTPRILVRGAIFSNLACAFSVGLFRCLIVMMMRTSRIEPLGCALGCWCVWTGARILGAGVCSNVYLTGVAEQTIVVACFCVLAVFLLLLNPGFISFERIAQAPEPAISEESGIEVAQEKIAYARSVQGLSTRFMLSEREADAALLYAQGYTQRRVAEEMNVSPSTAHEYIKRIYAKTDLHSRQELIDFLEEYPT